MPDTDTLDSTLTALYESISGPAGERDWERSRALFAPRAQLVPIAPDASGVPTPRLLSFEEFVEDASPYLREHSFYETEIVSERRVERFESLVHAFSTYESRHEPGEEPFMRGVNSIQLVDDGKRWWILSVAWPRRPQVLG